MSLVEPNLPREGQLVIYHMDMQHTLTLAGVLPVQVIC